MKNKTFLIGLFLILFFSAGPATAQNTDQTINQQELVKKFIGTWNMQVSKDTIEVWEFKPYGKSYQLLVDYLIRGEKVPWRISTSAYLKNEGKFRGFQIYVNGYSDTSYGWFTSENRYYTEFVKNFDPANVTSRYEMILDSPASFTFHRLDKDGKVLSEHKWKKVK